MKPAIRFVHLWAGLIFGTILVVLGLTGSALAWMHELDVLLNPTLLQVAPPPGMARGAPMRVAPATVQAATERLLRDPQYGRPSQLMFPERAGDVFVAWYRDPKQQASTWNVAVSRQVMLDPATLAVTGERTWGGFAFSRPQLMSTLFHIHRYLVAGDTGKTVIGVTGVALLLLSITGIVLWWPRMTASAIKGALTVRHGGNWPRFNFQLHRAGGFFAAPVLLVLAVSGVYFNLPQWVLPVVGAVATLSPAAKPVNRSAPEAAPIAPSEAMAVAQAQFPNARVSRLALPAKPGQPYEIRLRQPSELRAGDGATRVSIDAGDASVLRTVDPQRAPAGDTFLSWMFPLHTGEAFGIAGRTFISIFGVVPLMFFVTGLVIWIKLHRPKKRKAKPLAA
ncbi:PepSY-associated TM helix domain-containing protein [Massilia sp. CCM 9210]|uniref:PepSY-associated TM helix domain-containing protein n=1 Tax=Massilia scottii TaxID=3057166 RepID=UPI002796B54D|nr:PepSY-associated TM helix domain-containing protein [Massilia sp. CCM 9210]MDQ1813247.1 PepSY-associated TM helix domain-containing protein [Massilia sp. CCM 9210]